jgi:hypothetical protein
MNKGNESFNDEITTNSELPLNNDEVTRFFNIKLVEVMFQISKIKMKRILKIIL